jgi:dTDP-glucose 4,6-dehydratase
MSNPKLTFIKGDICDEKLIDSLFIGADQIIHFAAESHVDRSISGASDFVQTNIVGVQVLLDAIKDSGKKIRFLQVSTDEVYGSYMKGLANEYSSYKPNSPYSASKAAADHIARSFVETFKLPITILNFCNNYGPYQFPEKFIPTIIIKYLNHKKIPIYGSGLNSREWIHVNDTCNAIFFALKKFSPGKKYNIGSNVRCNNLFISKKICKLLERILNKKNSRKLIKKIQDRPGHDARYALNSALFRKEYNWRPKINFSRGLSETICWYIENKNWINFTMKKYQGQRLGI